MERNYGVVHIGVQGTIMMMLLLHTVYRWTCYAKTNSHISLILVSM